MGLLRGHRAPARGTRADKWVVLVIEIASVPESGHRAWWQVRVWIGVDRRRIPVPIWSDDPPPAQPAAVFAMPPMAAMPIAGVEIVESPGQAAWSFQPSSAPPNVWRRADRRRENRPRPAPRAAQYADQAASRFGRCGVEKRSVTAIPVIIWESLLISSPYCAAAVVENSR